LAAKAELASRLRAAKAAVIRVLFIGELLDSW
jgi:hypothetical protein